LFALHGVGLAGSTARRTVEGRQFETFVEDVADGGRTADVEQSVLVEMVSRQRQFQIAAARLAVHRNTFHGLFIEVPAEVVKERVSAVGLDAGRCAVDVELFIQLVSIAHAADQRTLLPRLDLDDSHIGVAVESLEIGQIGRYLAPVGSRRIKVDGT